MQSEMPSPAARCGPIPAPFGESREPAIAVHPEPVVVDRDRELDAAIDVLRAVATHPRSHWARDLCALDRDGERWVYATHGAAIAAVRGLGVEAKPSLKGIAPVLFPDEPAVARGHVSAEAIAAWLGATPSKCARCAGAGSIPCVRCDGSGKVELRHRCHCGHVHSCKCSECEDGLDRCDKCDGNGAPTSVARIGGTRINREILRPLLPLLVGTIEACAYGDRCILIGDGVRVVVMTVHLPARGSDLLAQSEAVS